MKGSYSFEDMNKFLKKSVTEKEKIIDKLGDGKSATAETLAKRSNSRDDLAIAIITLGNYLTEAQNWIAKVHSAHFELLNEHVTMQKIEKSKTMEAIEKLADSVDEKLVEKVERDTEHSSEAVKKQFPPDWTKINFETSVSEAVSKSIRTERKKDKELAEKSHSFIIFGVKPDDVNTEDQLNAKWNDYDSLVKHIVDESFLDEDNDIVKWEKLGKSDVPPLRVTMKNPECVMKVLRYSPWFKTWEAPLNRIYIGPDRTSEQIKAHKRLVEQLKEKIKEHPRRRWIIRNGTIIDKGAFVAISDWDRDEVE